MKYIPSKLLVISCLLFFNSHAQKRHSNPGPNIIFILADDLGYGDIGCYGQQKIETPNIDKLANSALKFTQFYTGCPVCAPARSTLLTGLHTGHTPVRGNKTFQPEGQTPLPDSIITFTKLLQQHGYTTAAFGKWSLGYITTSGDPNKQGFDNFYGYNCQTLAHNYYPDHLWNNHQRVEFQENKNGNKTYSADIIHQMALSFIRTARQPFFAYLPYTLPHAELIVPHDSIYYYYIKKFNEKADTTKAKYDGRIRYPYPHAAYAAMVTRLDRYVGEVVKAVQEKGAAENTLIIFTSDNGPHEEGGADPPYFNSNSIYRGIKRDVYEGGIREPFIAYWPGEITPGVTSQTGVLYDMYPTILELSGIKNKNRTDGLSLLPTLLNKGRQQQHPYLYWEFHENGGRQAVRWKNWKAIKLEVNKNPGAPIELYNLKDDPSETNNVAIQYPAIVRKMEEMMKEAHVQNVDWPLLYNEIKQ